MSTDKVKVRKENLYNLFKPYVGKLFAYIILLVIAVNGWKLFKDNQKSYEDLLKNLKEKLVVDIQFVNKTEMCPRPYEDAKSASFQETFDGCICNGFVMKRAQCEIFSKPNDVKECEKTDVPSFNSYFETCDICYTEIEKVDEMIIDKFYSDVKPCIKFDEEMDTIDYLRTSTMPCSDKNRCNDFFCKANDDPEKRCPVSMIAVNMTPAMNMPIPSHQQGPFVFADGYEKYSYYDPNNHGYINAPVTGIYIALNAVCDDDMRRYVSDYPLIKLNSCHPMPLFHNFDTKYVDEVLRNNGIDQIVYNKLLRFKDSATSYDTWSFAFKSAIAQSTLYCIINTGAGRDLNVKNLMTIFSELKKDDEEERREIFKEYMYVFINIEDNANFQQSVQQFMLFLNILVTIIQCIYVLCKFFHSIGVNLRPLLKILRFEGYLCFVCDIGIAITGYITYHNLHHFIERIDDLIRTNCLDEFTFGKLSLYKSSSQVVSDKNREIFAIVFVKLVMVLVSVITVCVSKHGKVPFSELQELICEVRELPEDKFNGKHKQMEDEMAKEEEKPESPEFKIEHLDK